MPRPRFSLRTLLIAMTLMGLLSAWCVVQLQWIKDRRQAIQWLGASKQSWYAPSLSPKLSTDAPWSIRVFGEAGVVGIGMDVDEFKGKVPYGPEQLKVLFPEAHVDYSLDGNFITEWKFPK
jgi:hypothetical protein